MIRLLMIQRSENIDKDTQPTILLPTADFEDLYLDPGQ